MGKPYLKLKTLRRTDNESGIKNYSFGYVYWKYPVGEGKWRWKRSPLWFTFEATCIVGSTELRDAMFSLFVGYCATTTFV